MEQLKLKPCPFCGGRARVIGKRRSGSTCYCISCSSCGAKSRVAFVQPWHDNSDVMFDYDSMDDHLRELLKEYDIDPDDYEEEEENGKD